MAITDKKTGVWGLDQTYNKINQGSIWEYSGATNWMVWGSGASGVLGLNSTTNVSSPTQLTGTDWNIMSSAGYNASTGFGIKTDGTLWSWGENDNGELGQNNKTACSSPIQIGSDTNWSTINSTGYGALGTKTDGTLWVWGRGNWGSLGNNTGPSYYRSSPVQVPGTTWPTDMDKMGTGATHTLAIKTDGTLWVWGRNYWGQLGINADGNGTEKSSPVQIPGTTWSSIGQFSGNVTSGALKSDGTLWMWGYGMTTGTGQGAPGGHRSSPTQVPGTTWAKKGQYENVVLATKTDGTLWSWGYNAQGQLGQNNTTQYFSPVQIPGTDWDYPFAIPQGATAAALCTRTDGTLWVWGADNFGSLGLNQQGAKYSSPVQIPGTGWQGGIGKMGTSGSAIIGAKVIN